MLIYLCYKYSVPLAYEQFTDARKAQCTERRAGHRPGLNFSPFGLRTDHGHSSFIHSFITTFKRSHCKLHAQCHDLSLPISTMYKMVLHSFFLRAYAGFYLQFSKQHSIYPLSVVNSTFQILTQKPKIVCQICM